MGILRNASVLAAALALAAPAAAKAPPPLFHPKSLRALEMLLGASCTPASPMRGRDGKLGYARIVCSFYAQGYRVEATLRIKGRA